MRTARQPRLSGRSACRHALEVPAVYRAPVTTAPEVCDRCGQAADHLFPDASASSRICSRCYEAQRLHQQGTLLSNLGLGAIVLGAGLLLAIAIILLIG